MNVRKPIQSALKKTYIPKGFDFQKIFAGLPCCFKCSERSLVVSDLRSETKVQVRLLAMCRSELSAVIARLMSNCLLSGWKW